MLLSHLLETESQGHHLGVVSARNGVQIIIVRELKDLVEDWPWCLSLPFRACIRCSGLLGLDQQLTAHQKQQVVGTVERRLHSASGVVGVLRRLLPCRSHYDQCTIPT
jgi:hypothetical protein